MRLYFQHYFSFCLTAIRGHETTAHSLGFTLALLATHQDIQEKAFQQLRSIVPEGETPVRSSFECTVDWRLDLLQTYAQILKWNYGLAMTHESLRMFPPVIPSLFFLSNTDLVPQVLILPRYAAHDTVFTTSSIDGKNTPITVPVPQGTKVIVSIVGLHYNRQCYPCVSHDDR
jgi:cytochrome P450